MHWHSSGLGYPSRIRILTERAHVLHRHKTAKAVKDLRHSVREAPGHHAENTDHIFPPAQYEGRLPVIADSLFCETESSLLHRVRRTSTLPGWPYIDSEG